MAFQGESSFLQNTQLQLESLPTDFHDQGEDVLLQPVGE